MNPRERFNAVMNFQPVDRLPFMEFMQFWPETLDRFYTEGLSRDVDVYSHFGYDPFGWFPVDFGFRPAFVREVLEEDADSRIVRDESGVVKREFKYGSAMPHYIEFPIKNRQDFLDIAKRLDATDPARYPADWEGYKASVADREFPMGLVCRGFLAFERDFMDFQDMAVAFAEEPEWIEEMMDFHLDFLMKLWGRVLSECEVDFVLLGEDMAYKNGPMISPSMVRRFMTPRYKILTDFIKSHGCQNIIVDSDGDMRSIIPCFLDGGITGILPMEGMAGVNPVELRKEYPRLQMIGGIDKLVVEKGGDIMRQEVEGKVNFLKQTGGYIPSCDHSVHPGMSYAVYQDYLKTLKRAIQID
ncbi:MAG: uroporphyrinogen decarboxylase family protein [Armatimonadota bacterium]